MALNFDTEFRYGIWAWNLSIEFGYGFQIWNLGIELGHEFQVWNSSLLSFKGVRDSGNRIYRPFGLVTVFETETEKILNLMDTYKIFFCKSILIYISITFQVFVIFKRKST